MKVVEFPKHNVNDLKEFAAEIEKSETKPCIYMGFSPEGRPVLWVNKCSWDEMSRLKFYFDMHVTADYLNLDES